MSVENNQTKEGSTPKAFLPVSVTPNYGRRSFWELAKQEPLVPIGKLSNQIIFHIISPSEDESNNSTYYKGRH
jgi:hypothetical protein